MALHVSQRPMNKWRTGFTKAGFAWIKRNDRIVEKYDEKLKGRFIDMGKEYHWRR
jgi:hypothetical protein